MDDWRLTGQEEYLQNATLKKVTVLELSKKMEDWHEHCEFCMEKISRNQKERCYCTKDEYRWICSKCFLDFNIKFNWKIER
ncbi:MAG: hypothetical protein J6C97_02740 [Clostridia bacterium]|nr:hypothetical protein [Clostridia bacterium]